MSDLYDNQIRDDLRKAIDRDSFRGSRRSGDTRRERFDPRFISRGNFGFRETDELVNRILLSQGPDMEE